jgi:transcriptional regulator with XRE-family HTH domain
MTLEHLTIGETVKRLRIERGISQSELARLAGVDGSYISQLESGKRKDIRVSMVNQLAEALGVDPSIFLTTTPRERSVEDLFRELEGKVKTMFTQTSIQEIPLKGTIPGSYPFPIDFKDKTVSIDMGTLSDSVNDMYALRVMDNSLQTERIFEGYTLLIKPTKSLIEGKLYIIRVGSQLICKRINKLKDLLDLNTKEKAEIEVLGRVVKKVGVIEDIE